MKFEIADGAGCEIGDAIGGSQDVSKYSLRCGGPLCQICFCPWLLEP